MVLSVMVCQEQNPGWFDDSFINF